MPQTLHVLLVEDDNDVARLMQTWLVKPAGGEFRATRVRTLAAALERVRRDRFDVVLLDLGLPDSEGIGTIARWHAEAPDLPVVIASAMGDQALVHDAMNQGAQDYLIKGSFGKDLLARALSYAIEHKQAEEALRASREHLRALADRMESVREEERTRISRQIHDDLGHSLTALKMELTAVGKRLAKGPAEQAVKDADARIEHMKAVVDGVVATVRRIATELRPSLLDHLGLAAAIEWECEEFERRTGVSLAFRAPDAERALPDAVATGVFRVFQEIMTNVARHAGARRVAVTLALAQEALDLAVQDDGRGITQAEASDPASLGILNMRERVRALGGTFAISGAEGQGTSARVRVPLPLAEEDNTEARSGERP